MKTTVKEQDNMGGVVRLWAVHYQDLEFNGEMPELISEERIFCMELTQERTKALFEQHTEFNGTTYLHEISGFVPGFDAETEIMINEMTRIKKFVVIYQDSQGTLVMLGRPKIPIRFSAGFKTGEESQSRRGYAVKFSGNVHYPPVRLSENIFE